VSRPPSLVRQRAPADAHLRILAVIRGIPRGRVLAYADVARLAGLPGRARLVGRILAGSPLAAGVPWHRVVTAGGRIAARTAADMSEQRRRLLAEGVRVSPAGRLSMARYRWGGERARRAVRPRRSGGPVGKPVPPLGGGIDWGTGPTGP
jgi:methylated-DNA-protein-cysteine methyltransferase-like protein